MSIADLAPPLEDQKKWDQREDGSMKGLGFLGPLAITLPNGSTGVVTEYSIADSEKLKDAKGNYLEYPSLVPTLTRDEVQAVLHAAATKGKLPDSVYDKAEAFALMRRAQGKPLFAQDGEQYPLHPELPRSAIRGLSGDIALPNQSGARDPRLPPLGSIAALGLMK